MVTLTLNDWIEQLKARFNERELKYMATHKAKINLQLKDKETGEIHLHELEYRSREAEDLAMVILKQEDKTHEQSL